MSDLATLKQCQRHPGKSGEYYLACYVCTVEAKAAADAAEGGPRERRYPIAPNGVFWSLQGEGHLRGFQMGFLRLAGCSVGCAQCDTNYSVHEKLTLPELQARCQQTFKASRDGWVWITGGEPADHELRPLLGAMKDMGYSTAVATSGVKRLIPPVDWLSVSPHSADPARFQQRYGSEVKLVDGLNGLDIDEWAAAWDRPGMIDFMYRYVQPRSKATWEHCSPELLASGHPCNDARRACSCEAGGGHDHLVYREDPASLGRCLAFLRKHPTWALSRQDHHAWSVA